MGEWSKIVAWSGRPSGGSRAESNSIEQSKKLSETGLGFVRTVTATARGAVSLVVVERSERNNRSQADEGRGAPGR